MTRNGEDETGAIFYKKNIYFPPKPVIQCNHFHAIILYASLIIKVYFTLDFFAKYIVILTI